MWLAMLPISADCHEKGVIPWHKSIQGFKSFEFRLIVPGKCIYYAKKNPDSLNLGLVISLT
jgi:hypothetical protein